MTEFLVQLLNETESSKLIEGTLAGNIISAKRQNKDKKIRH